MPTEYNATLWVLRGELALACFRVSADAGGRVRAASVADFVPMDVKTGCDQAIRTKVLERYGEQREILVQVDGGAGFEIFHRGGLPERPKPPAGPARQQQMDL